MEVMLPANDFHFDSAASSPYVSAPSSPKGSSNPFDYYYHYTSAPTSPARVAAVLAASSSSVVPFNWKESPATPKSGKSRTSGGDDDREGELDFDFAFDFSGQLEKGGHPPAITTADVLFEEGKIRPLKLPPRLHSYDDDKTSIASSPQSPRSHSRRSFWPASPRRKEIDPFAAAMVEATRERGRPSAISSSRSKKGSRSLSPLREGVAGGFFQKSSNAPAAPTTTTATTTTIASECMKSSSAGGSKKWRLKDLLLFRSASEGRVTGNRSKDPLRKFTAASPSNSPTSLFPPPISSRRGGDDSRSSSFRSTDSGGSIRRGSKVSAHERHYMSNRAASEEMKKKTPLPYRPQGIFGCLRYNPAVNSIVKGFQSSYSFDRRPS